MPGVAEVKVAAAALVVVFAAAGIAAEGPRVQFTKSWPQSEPQYIDISLWRSGDAEYRESPTEEPLRFRITETEAAHVFALVENLNRFKRPLESNLKVAKTGVKTFRYEHGAEKNEVQFNYSQDLDAVALLDWFERVSLTERSLLQLERAARYDRLGVNKALLDLEMAHGRAQLVAPQQFIPILERIIKNTGYMHMARERAAKLAETFRQAGAASQ